MTIELPISLEGTLSQQDLRLRLALGLFVSEDLTLAQSADYAGITRDEFLKEMEMHDMNIHYGTQEFSEDLVTLRKDGLL